MAFVWTLLACACLVPGVVASANPSLSSLHHALERGDPTTAESGFQHLLERTEPEVQSQGWAGLAAVAWHRGDWDRVLDFAAKAEALDPEIVYSHVVRGHVYWGQGQMEAAKSAYRSATENAHGEPWQFAIAANRLGRIYAIQGFGGTAENYYDRAISQHPERAVFYTNKAYLLEALNRPGEALELYRKALRLEPADRLTQALLHRAEANQTGGRQSSGFRSTTPHDVPLVLPGDDWTSQPLHLVAFHITQQDIYFPRAGQAAGLVYGLAQILRQDKRLTVAAFVQVADAKAMAAPTAVTNAPMSHQLRAELRITVDPQLPHDGTRLHLQLVRAEEMPAQAAVVWTPETSDDALQQLADQLRQQLRRAYPIRGRIIRISPRGIRLNIGSTHGVTEGLNLQLLKRDTATQTNQAMGLIEITQVNPHDAWAKVIPDTVPWHEVWQIQNVQEVTHP